MGKDTIHRNFTAPLIKRFVRKGFPVLMCLGLASCSSDDAGKSPLADEESDILVMVGDSALTMREVLAKSSMLFWAMRRGARTTTEPSRRTSSARVFRLERKISYVMGHPSGSKAGALA